ncbi:MAG: hypothetical protein RIQ88_781 [Actinomycetota bacterium]
MANKSKIEASARKSIKSFEEKQNIADHKAVIRAKDNRLALIISIGLFAAALLSQFVYFSFGPGISPTRCITLTPTPQETGPDGKPKPNLVPDAAISQCKDWTGTITINKKPLQFTLWGEKAPQAVANFIDLSSVDFFTGNNCHRLVTSGIYVLQCGDPGGTGTGTPGYTFGPIENAPAGSTPTYKKGWLAMARSANSASSQGSQFFIVYKDSKIPSDAAGGYTVFGEITSGLDTLDNVIKAGVVGGGSDGKPKVPAVINSTKVN